MRPTANDQYCEVPATELQTGFTFTASENKVAKCEIFDLFDFNDFYVIKSL